MFCSTEMSVAWVSYLNISILMATLAIALFNASKDNVGRYFAYVYAIISIGTLVCIDTNPSGMTIHKNFRYMAMLCTNTASP